MHETATAKLVYKRHQEPHFDPIWLSDNSSMMPWVLAMCWPLTIVKTLVGPSPLMSFSDVWPWFAAVVSPIAAYVAVDSVQKLRASHYRKRRRWECGEELADLETAQARAICVGEEADFDEVSRAWPESLGNRRFTARWRYPDYRVAVLFMMVYVLSPSSNWWTLYLASTWALLVLATLVAGYRVFFACETYRVDGEVLYVPNCGDRANHRSIRLRDARLSCRFDEGRLTMQLATGGRTEIIEVALDGLIRRHAFIAAVFAAAGATLPPRRSVRVDGVDPSRPSARLEIDEARRP